MKPGLEGLPPSFELNPILKEAMYCLEKIHVELVCSKLAEEKQAAELVVALASQVPEPAIPCVLRLGGPKEDLINGHTLHMGGVEGTEGSVPNGMAVHIGWIPVQSARVILDLPEPDELSQSTGLFLDIESIAPTGETIDLPV